MSRPFPFSMRRCAAGLSLVVAAATLAGCDSNKWGFPYIAGVQQGNWITSTEVSQLQVGMTRDQVRFLLGSPTLTSVLRTERWDYPYYFKPGYGQPRERTFTVWFDASGKVARWEGDAQPEFQPYQVGPNALKLQGQGTPPVPSAAGQPAVPAGTPSLPTPVKSVMLPIAPNSTPTTRTASPPPAGDTTHNTQGGNSSSSSSGSASSSGSSTPASTTTP